MRFFIELISKINRNKKVVLNLVFVSFGLVFLLMGETNAFYKSEARIYENKFILAQIELPEKGDVVINEIMWPGSSRHELDEWVELRNMTNKEIDLTGWKLYGAGPNGHDIELEGVIPANGYFLLMHYKTDDSKSAVSNSIKADQVDKLLHLKDQGEKLRLVAPYGVLVDETPDIAKNNRNGGKAWAAGIAGSNGKKSGGWRSMERNDEPGEGADKSNWHTCNDDECKSTDYWDSPNDNNYGTPKNANSEEEDAE